jgi:hypothetical protein
VRSEAKPFDTTTKYLVELDPAGWLEYLGYGHPEQVSIVDADLATVAAEADKVVAVAGPPAWMAQIELQSSYDPSLPQRQLHYSVILRGRHGVPIRSTIVLLRRAADGPAISSVFEYQDVDGSTYLRFSYRSPSVRSSREAWRPSHWHRSLRLGRKSSPVSCSGCASGSRRRRAKTKPESCGRRRIY